MKLPARAFIPEKIRAEKGWYTMDALTCIETRRSIRKYKPDMVPKEIIDKIVEAGTYAATEIGRAHV